MRTPYHPGDCIGAGCKLCWNAAVNPKFQRLWNLPPGLIDEVYRLVMSNRPCNCEKIKKASEYTSEQCLQCWQFWHRRDLHTLWGGGGDIFGIPRSLSRTPEQRGEVEHTISTAPVHTTSNDQSPIKPRKRVIDPNKPRLSFEELAHRKRQPP